MQVILIENIMKLGKIGDQVEVKNGFARNYLLRHLTIKYKKLDTETEYFKERNGSEKKK